MRSRKSKFFCRSQIQVCTISCCQCHGLSEIMIEIIMHLIPSPLFPAPEYIHIISCLESGGNNAHHSGLIRPAFRFTKIDIAISHRSKLLSRFCRSRKTGKQVKRMIAFHYRIARYSIYAYCIVTWKLRIIFGIIQATIQSQTNSCIWPKHISFSIKFHGDAVSVHVVSFTGIQRNHQTMTRMHSVPLHQP